MVARLVDPAEKMPDSTFAELVRSLDAARWIELEDSNRRFVRLAFDLQSRVHAGIGVQQTVVERLVVVLAEARSLDDGSVICNQLVYLATLVELARMVAGDSFVPVAKMGTAAANARLQAPLRDMEQRLGAYRRLDAVRVLRLCLVALLDGRHAAGALASDEGLSTSALVQAMGVDSGVATYGTSGDVPTPRDRIPLTWLRPPDEEPPDGRTTVLYSADPVFIRKYAPRLLFYAGLFPEFRYHLHLVGDFDECLATAQLLDGLSDHISDVRGMSRPVRLGYSWSTVPEWIPNSVSYFASARFLIAKELLAHSQAPVWIQDVDLFPTADITRHQAAFDSVDVAIVVSRFLGGLFPWKRYLAGNVHLRPTAATERFLGAVEDYLDAWLGSPQSWMVDQNALAYAAERVPEASMLDMGRAGVQMRQSFLPNRIEA